MEILMRGAKCNTPIQLVVFHCLKMVIGLFDLLYGWSFDYFQL
jgi:hypothetical protein